MQPELPELLELLLLDDELDEEEELEDDELEELPEPLLVPGSPLLDAVAPEDALELALEEEPLGRASRPASRTLEPESVRVEASSPSSDSNSVPVAHAVAAVPMRTKQKVRPRSRRCIVDFAVARDCPRGKEHRSQFAQMLRRELPARALGRLCRKSASRLRKRRARVRIECYPAVMDELPEKSGAGNLPAQSLPCWNESMHPSKAELSTGSSTSRTGNGGGEGRRGEREQDRELGMAMTDALADILRNEKDPRQRRSVS